MYSEKIQKTLKSRRIKIGDRVLVRKAGKKTEGILMPQTEAGDPETLVLKLDSGYNAGIKFKNAGIEKSKTREPRAVEEEEEYELGKTKKGLLRVKFNPRKPPVSIVSVGGTIASRVEYETGGVKAMEDPREFLHNVPELGRIVNVRSIERPFTKMSEDMDYRDWQEIARVVARRLNAGDKGVIVTHGTDFLHMTAAALSFFLRDLTKPVVLVGAQRSSDRGSSDAGMNLICASHAATGEIAEVGVCMHGRIDDDYCLFMRGSTTRKMDSQRRDAFRPINEYPLVLVWPDGKTKVKNWNHKKRDDKGKIKLDIKFEPKVAMLKVYPGADPDVINYYVSKGYKGFVVEASGLGHVPTNGKNEWISTIKKHAKDGIPFVTTLQTIYGRINTNVYTNLRILYREAGAISGQNMLTEVAFVKLGWILGHTKNMENIRKMISTNYAGEITKRTLVGCFLY
jgi:glutamyl-tRNA(Gln) amidotransferase subunit D